MHRCSSGGGDDFVSAETERRRADARFANIRPKRAFLAPEIRCAQDFRVASVVMLENRGHGEERWEARALQPVGFMLRDRMRISLRSLGINDENYKVLKLL